MRHKRVGVTRIFLHFRLQNCVLTISCSISLLDTRPSALSFAEGSDDMGDMMTGSVVHTGGRS